MAKKFWLKNVLVAIAVIIGHASGEGRGKLRLARERDGEEMVRAVEEEGRGEGGDGQAAGLGQRRAGKVGERGARISGVGRETAAQEGQRGGERVEIALRQLAACGRVTGGFQQGQGAAAVKVTRVKQIGELEAGVLAGVQSPVSGQDVQVAIAIEIANRDPVPPAQELEAGPVRR